MLIKRVEEMPTLALETWRRLIVSDIHNSDFHLITDKNEIIEKSILLCKIINLGIKIMG